MLGIALLWNQRHNLDGRQGDLHHKVAALQLVRLPNGILGVGVDLLHQALRLGGHSVIGVLRAKEIVQQVLRLRGYVGLVLFLRVSLGHVLHQLQVFVVVDPAVDRVQLSLDISRGVHSAYAASGQHNCRAKNQSGQTCAPDMLHMYPIPHLFLSISPKNLPSLSGNF